MTKEKTQYEVVCKEPMKGEGESNHSPYLRSYEEAEGWLTRNLKPGEVAEVRISVVVDNRLLVESKPIAGYTLVGGSVKPEYHSETLRVW